jgi:hypothetical protein
MDKNRTVPGWHYWFIPVVRQEFVVDSTHLTFGEVFSIFFMQQWGSSPPTAIHARPPAIQSMILAFAPPIQSAVDALAPSVQASIDPVAFVFQPVGQPFPALFPGSLLPPLQAPFPSVAPTVEAILDPVAFAIQSILATVTATIQTLLDTIPAAIQPIARIGSIAVSIGPAAG